KYGKEFLYLVEELRQAQGLVTDFAAIDKIDQALTIHDKHEIVVNGGHLMKTFDLKPGPVLGELLKEVEFQIVEGQLENEEQAIMTFVKGILENE
ncbi:tRNA nucleotidyltransferase domain-containing protein, partial [Streptococcus suis]